MSGSGLNIGWSELPMLAATVVAEQFKKAPVRSIAIAYGLYVAYSAAFGGRR